MTTALQTSPPKQEPDRTFDFLLPDELAAREPPEVRGGSRDAVRLMVTSTRMGIIVHTQFREIGSFLSAGDVLVVNTSATIPAALAGRREAQHGHENIRVHLSAPVGRTRWVIELRRITAAGTSPLFDAERGERIQLAGGATALLVEPYGVAGTDSTGRVRLWVAELDTPATVMAFAGEHGVPIRYSYVPEYWPLASYQTVFSREPGSAEMPSAGRAFTPAIVATLLAGGVRIVPLLLHTGVSSLESDEAPYPERFRVPESTADAVNRAHLDGKQVIAVGTTVVRALESAATADGTVRAARGWTHLVITPERGLYATDGVLTGFHAPRASHLSLLETLAGRHHLAAAYHAALRHGYRWHEFGDLHLLLA
jgi:S-adenosylmethionine:tRNA ribosyltransferase-isomerase